MVFDHINRMEKFDPSYRAEYETALKHASVTAFIGKTPLMPITDGLISTWVYVRFRGDGL